MLNPDAENDTQVWTDPETSFRVTYPISLFHEIDFTVNESYRRIPRGGIETAAILVGRGNARQAHIEGFRPIACEHALGPSFKLSEADLAKLRSQVDSLRAEPDTTILGWFIAHTRNPLELTDSEAGWFDEFLPGAGKLTLLIKPEKFKPTQFAFLVRQENGHYSRDLTGRTFILPLTGRPSQSGEPEAAPPAPVRQPDVPAAARQPDAPPASKPDAPPAARPEEKVEALPPEAPPATPVAPVPPPPVEDPLAAVRKAVISARQAAAAEPLPRPAGPKKPPPLPERPMQEEQRLRPVAPLPVPAAMPPSQVPVPVPRPDFLPAAVEPAWPIDAYPAPTSDAGLGQWSPEYRAPRRPAESDGQSRLQFAVVMIAAAALGCALGYLAYLQLPSPVIPLNVQPEPSGLTVYWPAEQTRSAVYAAIRVNDGEPIALPPDAKTAGHSRISTTGDNTKIELIAQHWMRDSRGIARYVVGAQQAEPPPMATKTPVRTRPSVSIPRPEDPAGTQPQD